MIYSDVTTDIYRILKDPGKVAFTSACVAKAVTAAVRKVLGATNTAVGRTTLSMVLGQQQYDLPYFNNGTPNTLGIRRLTRLRLVPAVGGEPKEIPQYQLDEITYTSPTPGDPYAFALISGQGATSPEQLSMFVWPTPARSAVGAFVIDYAVDYVFTSSTNDSTAIEVPETLTNVVAWLAAADCLLESDDVSDIQKSSVLRQQAERRIAENFIMESLTLRADKNRIFP